MNGAREPGRLRPTQPAIPVGYVNDAAVYKCRNL